MAHWGVFSRARALGFGLGFAITLPLVPPLVAGCSGPKTEAVPAPSTSAAAPPAEVTLSVVGTSDLHGRLSTLPLLASYVRALRASRQGGVVLVDAGDMFQGTLESNHNEGEAVVSAYTRIGYDAVAIGNHEFDYGPAGEASVVRKSAPEGPERDPRGALKARAAQAKGAFPFLAANLLEDDKPLSYPNVLPSTIVEKRGVSVGIIGVTSADTTRTTIAANVAGMRVVPLAIAIADQAKALREKGAEVVIVAAHAGGQCTKLDNPADLTSCDPGAEIFEVAKQLPEGSVQAIVAGHTHQAVAHEVAGIPVLQSKANGEAFGRVDLTVEPRTGKVLRTKIYPPQPVKPGVTYEGTAIEPADDVSAVVQPALDRADARRAESLGVKLKGKFPARYRDECALGNLLTSLLLELDPKMDIALLNGGGLRADLAPGALTYGALYDALPFDNRLARLTMTGRALRRVFAKNLSGKSGILSIAGARVIGRCEGDRLAVDIVLSGPGKAERAVRDDDRVLVLTNEFLATLGDGFEPAERVDLDEEGPPFRDPLAGAFKKRGGELAPEEWLVPGRPRVELPGPIGPGVCKR